MVKLNNSIQLEQIEIKLDEVKTPIAFKNKLEELMENGMSEEEARQFIYDTTFEMDIYYDKNNGLFAVESDAVENGATIYSPYTAEECEPYEEEYETRLKILKSL